MLDMNGKEIKAGFVVEVRGAYSDKDNGLYLVTHTDGLNWVSLHKLNKDMTQSQGKYATHSWPIVSYTNDDAKRYAINSHNRTHATIEMLCPYVEPVKKPVSNEMRILKNGIRKGEDYIPCYYWLNRDNSITVYARDYSKHLPRELGDIKNDSDSMTDYFEKDSCELNPGDKHYDKIFSIIQSKANK